MNEVTKLEYLWQTIDGRVKNLRRYQREVLKAMFDEWNTIKPRILIAFLPTGYGKTLIAESPFLYQAFTGSWHFSRGMVYVLPTRVLVNKHAEKIKNHVKKTPEKYEVKSFHGEAHSTAEFNADIAVTTFDTFVYAYGRKVSGYHMEFPFGTITTSYIVFDEAHMIQDEYLYSYHVLSRILRGLHKCGVPNLIMTATMPNIILSAVKEYLGEYTILEVIKPEEFREPLSSYRGEVEEIIMESDKNIIEYVSNNLKSWISKGKKRILVICNTVSTAVETYTEIIKLKNSLLKNWNIILIHSRLRRKIREEREKLLFAKEDSKEKGLPDKTIVISTQVVEAGLDISSDLLITECPIADSLIQRVGRCSRFIGEKNGIVVIVKPKDTRPYPKSLVENTWNLLKDKDRRGELKDALLNFSLSWDFINEAYKDYNPKYVHEDHRRDLLSFLDYLEGKLGEFIVDFDTAKRLRARPNGYISIMVILPSDKVTIYIAELESKKEKRGEYKILKSSKVSYNELLELIKKFAIEGREKAVLLLDAEELSRTMFNVDYVYSVKDAKTRAPKDFLIHKAVNGVIELVPTFLKEEEGRRKRYYRVIISNIVYEGTYLINPDFYEFIYDYDKGLIQLR